MKDQDQTNELALSIDIPPVSFSAPPIKFESKALEQQVKQALEPYLNTVVTEDTITGARKACATLNKAASVLDKRRKEIKDDWLVPLSVFEDQINEIRSYILWCRSEIAIQVEKFDTARRNAMKDTCRVKLEAHMEDKIAAFKLNKRFSSSLSVEPLLGKARYMTPTGNPTTEALNELEILVAKAKVTQDRYEERMAEVDRLNALHSFDPPLSEKSFGDILFADAKVWAGELDRIVSVQTAVQDAAEKRAKLDQPDETPKNETFGPSRDSESKPDKDGKVSLLVRVDIEVRALPSVPTERIKGAVKARLAKAGFSEIKKITVWEA